jgi:16S rRNA (uracil1498-N3)-methyltransferase
VSLPKIRLERCLSKGGGLWLLPGAEARHLVRCLRSYEGAAVEGLLEEDGARFLMRLERHGERYFLREVESGKEERSGFELTLLIGLLKAEQFDAVLRASSEIGVAAIIPIVCERSVPRLGELEAAKKVARWQKILDEGTSVSGAVFPPKISPPVKFADMELNGLPEPRYAAVLAPGARHISRAGSGGEVVFAVGPEGDWSERESSFLLENGFIPVTLGRRVMRASTAAIAGCSWFLFSCDKPG